jgi:hypothetical protein
MNYELIFCMAVLAGGAAACGASVVTGPGDSGTGAGAGASTTGGGGTTSAGTGGATGAGGATSGSPCPATATAAGSCAGVAPGFRCTYGDDARPDCREVTQCIGGAWTPMPSACSMSTVCGVTQPTAGTVCSNDGTLSAACTYGDVICLCDACAAGPCMAPPTDWQCAGPPTTAGCPSVVPNDGTPCTAEGTQCTYGFVCSQFGAGAEVSCTNGLWLWNTMIACGG